MRQEVNSHMKSSICPKDDVFVSLLGCLFRSHPIICAALLAALLTQIPVRVKILVSLTAKMGPAEAKDQECNPGVSLCSEEVPGEGTWTGSALSQVCRSTKLESIPFGENREI